MMSGIIIRLNVVAAILIGMAAPIIAYARHQVSPVLPTTSPEWSIPDESGLITIPDSVRFIPPLALTGREDIKQIVFSPGSECTGIGDYALIGCINLTDIQLPRSLKELGEGCFQECISLSHISLPKGIKSLSRELFKWCESLENVILPDSLTDIGSRAFIYCDRLHTVKPADMTSLDSGEGIHIPGMVTHIGSNAFGHCTALKRVVLPASIRELESYAFAECTGLREAHMPDNDSLLGELIFSGCSSLTDLYEPSPVPPPFDCDSYIFEPDETELYSRCRLHVPDSTRAAYASAPGWHLFPIIIPMSARPSQLQSENHEVTESF